MGINTAHSNEIIITCVVAKQSIMDFMKEKQMQRKNHCCLHCNEIISRAQNLKFHQQTCERNENRNKYSRFYGVYPDVRNSGFKLVESALKKMFVLYEKS